LATKHSEFAKTVVDTMYLHNLRNNQHYSTCDVT